MHRTREDRSVMAQPTGFGRVIYRLVVASWSRDRLGTDFYARFPCRWGAASRSWSRRLLVFAPASWCHPCGDFDSCLRTVAMASSGSNEIRDGTEGVALTRRQTNLES